MLSDSLRDTGLLFQRFALKIILNNINNHITVCPNRNLPTNIPDIGFFGISL